MGEISELIKQGQTTFYREEEPFARFTFHVVDKSKGIYGPWVTIEDSATDAGVLDPPKIIVTELPTDGWLTSPPTQKGL